MVPWWLTLERVSSWTQTALECCQTVSACWYLCAASSASLSYAWFAFRQSLIRNSSTWYPVHLWYIQEASARQDDAHYLAEKVDRAFLRWSRTTRELTILCCARHMFSQMRPESSYRSTAPFLLALAFLLLGCSFFQLDWRNQHYYW